LDPVSTAQYLEHLDCQLGYSEDATTGGEKISLANHCCQR